MNEFLQQLVSGIAVGCVYALVALGFVLIYKATDIVNFAHGEVMMVGAFLGLTFIEILKMPYWIGLLLAIACMTVFGMLLNRFKNASACTAGKKERRRGGRGSTSTRTQVSRGRGRGSRGRAQAHT